MVSFKGHKMGIQGDVAFTRIDKLPENLQVAPAENGYFVAAHSETGHNHAVMANTATLYNDPDDAMVAYLVVDDVADMEHHRTFDTHETVQFDKGVYRVNRQREYTPEGLRRVAD